MDVQNRLRESQNGSAINESYLYDDNGQRVKKTSNGVVTYYPFADYHLENGYKVKYYFFNGQPIARYQENGSNFLYLHADHLGSVVLTTYSGSGGVRDIQTYCVYGKQRSGTTCTAGNDLDTSKHFTGQDYDSTGLHYYRARYYDDHLGQFVSPDTLVPDATSVFSYNRFMYALGNPLKFSDPNGHEPCATGVWGDCSPSPSSRFVYNLAASRHQAGNTWDDLSGDMQAVLNEHGGGEGEYNDLGGNTSVQTGWKDPATLAATMFGAARLLWRLPALLLSCADDGCETEYRTYEMAMKGRNSLVSFQPLGGFSRDVLTKGYHLNSQVGEVSLIPQRLSNGAIEIAVRPAGGTTGTITNKIVTSVTDLLQSDTAGALQRAHGIVSSFGSDPRYAERVRQANLIIEGLTSGNYTVVQ